MAELRRLIIQPNRIKKHLDNENLLPLALHESHYLTRVLRLKKRDRLNVIDGEGKLWFADYISKDYLRFDSGFDTPSFTEKKNRTSICLAVTLPKQGFDNVLRMSTEIGIDIVQPIFSERSIIQSVNHIRSRRWESIINESIEQSERLWKPELRKPIEFSRWVSKPIANSKIYISTTRSPASIPYERELDKFSDEIKEIWTLIGPEGGWTSMEISSAIKAKCTKVSLGNTILRTSTASIVSTQLMELWRKKSS